MKLAKYFWDLNERALRETQGILEDPAHPKFLSRMVTFLSRCDRPKELFSLVSKKEFMQIWPRVRSYWVKIERQSNFRDWWQTIYEGLMEEYGLKPKKPKGSVPKVFLEIDKTIRQARVNKGLSQREVALLCSMKQPDVSMIEEGKKNITLKTLISICRALEIKKLEFTEL